MKIDWEKIFLILTLSFTILMIGLFILGIWLNDKILAEKFVMTGLIAMFIAAISGIFWAVIHFETS